MENQEDHIQEAKLSNFHNIDFNILHDNDANRKVIKINGRIFAEDLPRVNRTLAAMQSGCDIINGGDLPIQLTLDKGKKALKIDGNVTTENMMQITEALQKLKPIVDLLNGEADMEELKAVNADIPSQNYGNKHTKSPLGSGIVKGTTRKVFDFLHTVKIMNPTHGKPLVNLKWAEIARSAGVGSGSVYARRDELVEVGAITQLDDGAMLLLLDEQGNPYT